MSAQQPEIGEFFQAIIKGPVTRDDVLAAYHAAIRLLGRAPAEQGDRAAAEMDMVHRVLDALLICVPLADELLPPQMRGLAGA